MPSYAQNNLWLFESQSQQRHKGWATLGYVWINWWFTVLFFFPFWGTDKSMQTAHKGELKHFGFIPKKYFSSLMEHKHQTAIMHFSCLFLCNGRAGGSSVPDGKHLPLIGLQLSKAKCIRFIHSSTFSWLPVHKLKGSRCLRTVLRRRITNWSSNLIFMTSYN